MAYTVNHGTEHAVADRRPKYSFPYEKCNITVLRREAYCGNRFQYRPAEKNLVA